MFFSPVSFVLKASNNTIAFCLEHSWFIEKTCQHHFTLVHWTWAKPKRCKLLACAKYKGWDMSGWCAAFLMRCSDSVGTTPSRLVTWFVQVWNLRLPTCGDFVFFWSIFIFFVKSANIFPTGRQEPRSLSFGVSTSAFFLNLYFQNCNSWRAMSTTWLGQCEKKMKNMMKPKQPAWHMLQRVQVLP